MRDRTRAGAELLGLGTAVVGAALLISGALLPWITLGNGTGEGVLDARMRWIAVAEGRVSLIAGTVALVAAMLARIFDRSRRPLLVLAMASSLLAGGLALWTARDAEPIFADARLDHVAAGLSDMIGLQESAIRARLEIQRPPRVRTTVGIGALLSVAGAALTLAAAGLVLFIPPARRPRTCRSRRPDPPATVLGERNHGEVMLRHSIGDSSLAPHRMVRSHGVGHAPATAAR
jgi:hypothetical protein